MSGISESYGFPDVPYLYGSRIEGGIDRTGGKQISQMAAIFYLPSL